MRNILLLAVLALAGCVERNTPPQEESIESKVGGEYGETVYVFTPAGMPDVKCVLVYSTGVWCKESKQ